jgi:hypothetical protein
VVIIVIILNKTKNQNIKVFRKQLSIDEKDQNQNELVVFFTLSPESTSSSSSPRMKAAVINPAWHDKTLLDK